MIRECPRACFEGCMHGRLDAHFLISRAGGVHSRVWVMWTDGKRHVVGSSAIPSPVPTLISGLTSPLMHMVGNLVTRVHILAPRHGNHPLSNQRCASVRATLPSFEPQYCRTTSTRLPCSRIFNGMALQLSSSDAVSYMFP